MFHQFLVLLALVALSISTPVGLNSRKAANICPRENGIYDVCDTVHSFLRCRGDRPMMVFDCSHEPNHYCLIQNDKGSCNGLRPPPMNSTLTHLH
ncbi:hypothetical protein GGS24DRAFT_230960 [Hypoxylon argillaceum]|nr:hypothetical protein GGS24DRAFT_230960 [Hypoxylon argillaceum]KAI1154993.1 hypothetical protein F4825DRAFT_409252 [Nemania diffusa]